MYRDEGVDTRPEVAIDMTDSLVYYVKRNGAIVDPLAASVWVTVLEPSGAVKVARTQANVAQATGGKVVFTHLWSREAGFELWEDYVLKIEWQEAGGIDRADRMFFDVVLNKLECPIDESDMLEMYPDLNDHLKSVGVDDPTRFIKRAWSKLCNRLRSGKMRPSLLLERGRLVDPMMDLSLAFACRSLFREAGDVWHTRMVEHYQDYRSGIAGLGELKYDKDEDGLASNDSTKRANRRSFSV